MDAGRVLADRHAAELLGRTGTSLEAAFIALLPENAVGPSAGASFRR